MRRIAIPIFLFSLIPVHAPVAALQETGVSRSTAAQSTIYAATWESGIGSWFADNGVWDVGVPTSGPGAAYQGTQCAATVLAGNYPVGANSRLISPSIALPASPLDGTLELRFWHWFSLRGDDGDSAWVEISTTGPGGPWQRISNPFTNESGGWTQYVADLSTYAGQTVRIAFRLRDLTSVGPDVAPGWYVDNPSITAGRRILNNPEGFEQGTRGWLADRGVWQMGEPTSGPGTCHTGARCAATVLDGNYPVGADSRLIMPPFLVPAGSPELRFWHWFSLVGGDGDSAWVEISTAGPAGPWQRISNPFTNASGAWTQYIVELAPYAGQSVWIAFRLRDRTSVGPDVDPGWYVDDVRVVGLPEGTPNAPDLTFAEYSAGPPVLTWTNPPGPFDLIAIYAVQRYDFEPDLGNRIALLSSASTSFTDVDRPGTQYIYWISAVDSDQHESAPVRPTGVTAVEPVPGGRDPLVRAQAAPNPFQRTTAISFRLARRGHVRLEVLNVAGRLVTRLADEVMESGVHSRSFDARDLPAGVYFYRLRSLGEARTGKLALIR